jgi:kynurenine 3-monooxygenase
MSQIALVGGGLAGPLLSIYLARHGYSVDIYERRPDMRKENIPAGRSINLALSTRGIHALSKVGIVDDIMKIAIPMRGRMIHPPEGATSFQRYGRDDTEVIYATSRGELNKALLYAAEKLAGVRIHFNKRCIGMDLEAGAIHLRDERTGQTETVRTSPVIGTDGSASAIRMEMQKTGRFTLSQSYLDYGYKELLIPAGRDGSFLMEKHALHIWPRTTYMLIALPNMDGSFTATFFFPFEGEKSFERLADESSVRSFFTAEFPDVAPLMPTLLEDFFANPTGSMVTIKCTPWFVGNKAALLGDASHAIVPFFGQGMNCAFESCSVLDEIIGKRTAEHGKRGVATEAGKNLGGELDWESVFREFESLRKANTDAIADLAVENFVEMRDLVARPDFQLRKKIEQALQARWPERFTPKYSMVTFQRIPYAVAMEKGRIQEMILNQLASGLSSVGDLDWSRADRLIREHLGV